MASDPRIEAAAMAYVQGQMPRLPFLQRLLYDDTRRALAAADAADPLRDRDRMLPIIERTLMDHERSTDYRLTAEDVFDAIQKASDGK